jgi:hypothetical protein
MKRLLENWLRGLIRPLLAAQISELRLWLDLQHGTKYSIYADSLQASVFRLRDHVDTVKQITAEQVIHDRKLITKLMDRVSALEAKRGRKRDQVEPRSGA